MVDKDNEAAHRCLDELLELDESLNNWERDFVEAMDEEREDAPYHEHEFTRPQIEKIFDIHDDKI